MQHKVITPRASLPVSLADAKLHIRLDDVSVALEDDLITALINSATGYCEHYLQSAIGVQTLEVGIEQITDEVIYLPYLPTSITSITYDAPSGTTTTINYYFSTYDRTLSFYGGYYSSNGNKDSVRIRYTAGDAVISPQILTAIKLMVGHLYANREANAHSTLQEMPLGVKSLLDTVRLYA